MAKYQQDPNQVRLTRMYREWQEAEQRRQMAQQTLDGASGDALVREAKFKGAVDFVGGSGATWQFDENVGHVVITPGTVDEAPNKKPSGREIVLNGKMSAKQMQAVMGGQAHRARRRR